jgi:hypothetical protein
MFAGTLTVGSCCPISPPLPFALARPMTLEEYIAGLNSLAFWREFSFAQNTFSPRPGAEFELADSLVWFGDYMIAMQLKERSEETENPDIERSWFQKKVLGTATRQVRDTLQFLKEHEQIRVTNERGHSFDIRGAQLACITKVVVFLGGRSLPEDCWKTRHHLSQTAGFIHVVAAHDYLGIVEKLRVPEDIRRYFAYREAVVPKLSDASVDESDIMGAFLGEQDLPTPISRDILRAFVQDIEAFDLSRLIGSLHYHIETSKQPHDYYRIMLEFARIPRSVWREVKLRFLKSLEAVQQTKFTRPFRLSFPATDCAFMIAPLDPELPATGPARNRGLLNLTHAAMYDAKVSKGVGILISKDGNYVQIDWSLLEIPWKPDSEMDARLARSNPFRPASEKRINSFLFTTERDETVRFGRALPIVRDAVWPGLWRIKLPSGLLSDMVNLTRAKDAAISLGRTESQPQPAPATPKASAA